MHGRLSFGLLAVVLGLALFVGARGDAGPPTPAQRVERIGSEVRCPTCEGLAVSDSDAPASVAIREEIRRRVEAGESDDEVRAYLVSRYGRDILLVPEGTGVAALVWALPVAALVCAGAGLAVAFRRWGSRRRGPPSAEDRLLVERALGR